MEIIYGGISGVVSALGMGGGTILIVLLSIFMEMEQHKAQATNIVFFIPTSITSTIMNIKNKRIRWDFAKIITFFGVIGAAIGSVFSINLNTNTLKKLYGLFLAIIAIYEIFNLIKLHKNNEKNTI